MLLLGIGSLAGNLCVNHSLRIAPASVVVPFQYTLILWGMIFGYVLFAEVIGPMTLLGTAIIIAAGLFIFVREAHVRTQRSARGPGLNG
jgi:drug/metabolite transporter (DMT)-like permease